MNVGAGEACRRAATPWIQVAAVSEDQAGNVYRALVPMLQLGDVAHESRAKKSPKSCANARVARKW